MQYKVSFLLNNVTDGVGRLQMRVQWSGNMLKYNLGYAVNADRWDSDIQMCRNNSFHGRKKISSAEINKVIRQYRQAVETASLSVRQSEEPTRDEFKRMLDTALGKPGTAGSEKMRDVINDFIISENKVRLWSDGSVDGYRSFRTVVERWKKDAVLSDFSESGLSDFTRHLIDSGIRNTTIRLYLMRAKTILIWAEKSGRYSVDPSYKKFTPRIKTAQKTVVWLTWDEIMLLYNADGLGAMKRLGHGKTVCYVRDIFCLSCFTGLRWSDIHNLKHSDIHEGKIHVSVKKTAASIVIEMNKYSRAILERYKDYDAVYAMPRVSYNYSLQEIQKICEFVGIDTPVTVSYYAGSEKKQEAKPKYEFVGMHTGRRSFVCNALEKGISPQVIISWTGHASLEELKPYIAISDKSKESAMKLFDM